MAKILVVDDELEVRNALKRRLTREGYAVEVADSAESSVKLLESEEVGFDVVITDMSMENPDSGLKVLKAAIGHDIFCEVVVLTAYGNVTNAVQSMQWGAFDYVEKNIPGVDTYDLIVMKVEKALERRRSSINVVRRLEDIRLSGPKSGA